MFLYLFTIALIVANIICFIKHKYPHLFFVCLLLLPEYYGFELSESLPLITAKRIMYVILYVYVFINYRQNMNWNLLKPTNWKQAIMKKHSMTFYCLGTYFLFRIISNLSYISSYSTAIKTIFELVFEQLLLCIAVYTMKLSQKEIISLIRTIVYSSSIVFVCGILESFTGYRITDSLYTVNRYLLNEHFPRLGLLRSTFTFGIPSYFGNYCLLLIPLILMMYYLTKEKKFIFILGLDFFAILHSGCRSDMFFAAAIIFFSIILLIPNKEAIKHLIGKYVIIALSLILVIVVFSFSSPRLNYYYTGTVKSLLNEAGFHFDLNKDAPEGVEGYGGNGKLDKSGTYSRTFQFSGINYALSKNPLFGLGSGAQNRGDVYYYYLGHWLQINTYDVGYVEIFVDEGIIGFLGYIILLMYLMIKNLQLYVMNRKNKQTPFYFLFLLPISYLLCMLSTANMFSFLMLIVIVTISNPTYPNP